MLSEIRDGKVLDFRYKVQDELIQAFYIGDILIGQVFRLGKNNWSCVSWEYPHDVYPVDGFKSRYHASEFMLRMGKILEKEEEEKASHITDAWITTGTA